MYEAVHATPDGESSVARLVETAAKYGFDGVVVRNHADSRSDEDLESIGNELGVDVVDGAEVRAESPQRASGAVGNFRSTTTIVAVHGGSNAMNRFAVENDKVDVLAHPMAGDGSFNHVLAKAAIENGVRIEFSFADVLRETGGRRVRTLQSLRKLREIVEYYDAPYVVSGDPFSHLELRAPRELCALGSYLGFTEEWIAEGLREWGRLAERNREIRSESHLEPGVERGRIDDGE